MKRPTLKASWLADAIATCFSVRVASDTWVGGDSPYSFCTRTSLLTFPHLNTLVFHYHIWSIPLLAGAAVLISKVDVEYHFLRFARWNNYQLKTMSSEETVVGHPLEQNMIKSFLKTKQYCSLNSISDYLFYYSYLTSRRKSAEIPKQYWDSFIVVVVSLLLIDWMTKSLVQWPTMVDLQVYYFESKAIKPSCDQSAVLLRKGSTILRGETLKEVSKCWTLSFYSNSIWVSSIVQWRNLLTSEGFSL